MPAEGVEVMRRARLPVLFLLAACWAAPAHAQSTIRVPGQRPQYAVELEPHLILTPFGAPDAMTDGGYGLGARATIEILPEGFIEKLNDSVGVGFGLDWVRYSVAQGRAGCAHFEPGVEGVPICVETTAAHDSSYLFVPVVMQWNFWLHRRWSVFGEPGLALTHGTGKGSDFGVQPVFQAGGRLLLGDDIALTLRLGYPTFSLGASFLL